MKVGDVVKIIGGDLEGERGEVVMPYEPGGAVKATSENMWWVLLTHMNTELIEEKYLEVYTP